MKSIATFLAAGVAAFSVANVHAVELVKNGSLETGSQYNADFWVKPDLGTADDGEPANYTRVGSYASQVGSDPYGYAFGPHPAGQGTGTQIPTRTAWLGGVNPRTSILQQPINTAGYGSATLTFKLVYEDEDIANSDFLYVDFGNDRVKTVDLGAYYTNFGPNHREGGIHFWVLDNAVIDLTPYMDGTTKNLTFTVINDAKPSTSSSAWIDNVSIIAGVPEPTSFAAIGTLALVTRRRRA